MNPQLPRRLSLHPFAVKSFSSSSANDILSRAICPRRRRPPSLSLSQRPQRRPLHDSSDTRPQQRRRPLRAAVIGSGPSGFYAAKYLTSSVSKRLAAAHDDASTTRRWPFTGIRVDILERLPVPFGLVRYGVAPDHPEVKHVQNDFAAVSSSDVVSYFGNVDVGRDDVVSLGTLSSLYDVVVLAYGCQSDRELEMPGLDLRGVLTARQFVNWYNGHPEFGYVGEAVKEALGIEGRGRSAVVVGNGNVALDCARILAKGREGLTETDVPSSVLEVLGHGVEKVAVVGRRGHVQGAFTIKELRELTKLQKEGYDVSFRVRRDELDRGMTESSMQELRLASGRPKTRIDALLREAAEAAEERDAHEACKKSIELRLLLNPLRIESDDSDNNHNDNPRVHRIVFERTRLQGEPGKQHPVGTGEYEEIPADLVILSVGYKGLPLEGMDEDVFDGPKGIVANTQGKVCGDNNLFVVGWIKRGPTGIIGSNIIDAKETVASIMTYIDEHPSAFVQNDESDGESFQGRRGLIRHLEQNRVRYVTWNQYLQIDRAERERERLRSDVQPREKFLSVEEMLACLR